MAKTRKLIQGALALTLAGAALMHSPAIAQNGKNDGGEAISDLDWAVLFATLAGFVYSATHGDKKPASP